MRLMGSIKLTCISEAGISLLAFYYAVQFFKRSLAAYQEAQRPDHYHHNMSGKINQLAHMTHPDHPMSQNVMRNLQNTYNCKCSAENRYIARMAIMGGALLFSSAYLGLRVAKNIVAPAATSYKPA